MLQEPALPPRASDARQGIARAVQEVFAAIDAGTQRLASESGLACPPRCGRCCITPEVSASVAEMIPMAEEILRRGESARWRALLAQHAGSARCVAFRPDPGEGTHGRCELYEWRPSVCRAFGFAARRDKHGEPELIDCPVHAQRLPAALERARALVASGIEIPVLADAARTIALERPSDARILPIDRALASALEECGLRALLGAQEACEPSAPEALPGA